MTSATERTTTLSEKLVGWRIRMDGRREGWRQRRRVEGGGRRKVVPVLRC